MSERLSPALELRALVVLYDERCAFCCHCRDWVARQKKLIPIELIPMHSEGATRFPEVRPEIRDGRFIVIDDKGGVYFDSSARLLILYALAKYRQLSFQLASPLLYRFIDSAFETVSRNRQFISSFLSRDESTCTAGNYCQIPQSASRQELEKGMS